MPNFHTGKIQPKDQDAVSVGTSSTQVIPDNYVRAGLVLTNISENFVFLSLNGTAAVLYKGITLNPRGGVWEMTDYTFVNGVIYAIATGADSTLTIQEFTA